MQFVSVAAHVRGFARLLLRILRKIEKVIEKFNKR
jgi:hypothetical protein